MKSSPSAAGPTSRSKTSLSPMALALTIPTPKALLAAAIYNEGTVTISGSTFSNNSSSNLGGGIYNYESGTLSITNSTISNNSAYSGGGGILNWGTMSLFNSTISNNSASNGGGILNVGTTTSSGSIVAEQSVGR